MANLIKKLLELTGSALARNIPYYESRSLYIGMVAVFGFPVFYFVWHDLYPQPYENLWLRMTGSMLFIPILLNRYWPEILGNFRVVYWNLAILFALPFFFTFMLLMNGASEAWVQSLLVAVFVMILGMDWLSLMLHSLAGVALACLAYLMSTPEAVPLTLLHFEFLPVVLFAVAIGVATNYGSERIQAERERGMLETAGSIAHELRTPLMGIKAGAAGLRRHLPALLAAYRQVDKQTLGLREIRRIHLDALDQVLDRIENEASYSNTMIDMLIISTRFSQQQSRDYSDCSAQACVDSALQRYPFNSREACLVHWHRGQDFYFRGSALLLVHVLFNLIKNALRHIQQAGKGEIFLEIGVNQDVGRLLFRDTGSGIHPEILPFIFNRFFTTEGKTANWGAGIGLAFCRQVIRSFGGDISCRSQLGEFTEFIITLPISQSTKESR